MPVSDQWEISGEQIEFLELLGEGEFGSVYKGVLRKNSKSPIKRRGKSVIRRTLRKKVKDEAKEIVAVKLLRGNFYSSGRWSICCVMQRVVEDVTRSNRIG